MVRFSQFNGEDTPQTQRPLRYAGALSAIAVLGLAASQTLGVEAAVASSKTPLVEVAKVADLGSVLVTGQHQTLYFFTMDTPSTLACTGGCTKVWEPLLLPKGTKKIDAKGIKGLSTRKRSGRLQVQLDHKPLYRFVGDTKSGMDKGQGVEGSWFAIHANGTSTATPVVTPAAPASTTPSSTAPAPVTTTTKAPTSAPKATTTTTKAPTPTTVPATTTTTKAPPPPTTTPTTAPSGGYGY
jgi:predicted lipoprotein with Yx(FWY)xxD motif